MTVLQILQQMAQGMGRTVMIFCLTLLFSLPLGMLVTLGKMSRIYPFAFLRRFPNRFCRTLSRLNPVSGLLSVMISLLRGTPLMLQLMLVYFGPYFLLGIPITLNYQFYAVIIAFSINYAAYFAEIFRAGMQAIPQGQYEAAQVLGYGKGQTFFKIVLPQVVKHVLPPVTNEVITLIKDTSLAFVIAYAEMFTIAKQLVAKEATVVPFLVAAVFYFVFNALVAFVMAKAEKSLSYYH